MYKEHHFDIGNFWLGSPDQYNLIYWIVVYMEEKSFQICTQII